MAIKVIIQRREVKLGKKSGIKFEMRPNIHKEKGTDIGDVGPFYVAEREVSLAEGEAPYIFPSNTLRTSTVSICLYVVRFLICN